MQAVIVTPIPTCHHRLQDLISKVPIASHQDMLHITESAPQLSSAMGCLQFAATTTTACQLCLIIWLTQMGLTNLSCCHLMLHCHTTTCNIFVQASLLPGFNAYSVCWNSHGINGVIWACCYSMVSTPWPPFKYSFALYCLGTRTVSFHFLRKCTVLFSKWSLQRITAFVASSFPLKTTWLIPLSW